MKYFFGFLVTVILTIFLVILLVGGGDDKQTSTSTVPKSLADYSTTNTVAKLTVDGPVNANSEHRQIIITVGKANVKYELIDGYDGNVMELKNFANTQNAYANFLKALDHANYTTGDTLKEHQDERGYCPKGNRYIYELVDGSKSIQRFWSTSCQKPATYEGNVPITLDVYKAQVPNFNDLNESIAF
jgi:hypothetical protein